ncbi:Trk system potassium transporter TrkA [Mediterraneibacter glycyrrhizinilyticus]|uniref:Trk system potassium transporter TrkA n=1 Tax=Mediterraneibacter glycyrrhizinilyticus TaxID=342942 RepID=UPI0006D2A20C
MKIVIIGDGKVGYMLAKKLSEEDYDIVLIDSNEKKLGEAMNRLDVFCVTGEGGSVEVQKSAGVPEADLVIACTSTDECNMLSCLIARRLGARHTIARVRNPIYFKQIDILKEDLHLSMAVNPEMTVAGEISRLLLVPSASKVETFVKGRVELIEFPVIGDSSLVGMSLAQMYAKYQIKVLVCAVERESNVFIPDGEYVMQAGDRLHMTASHAEINDFFKTLGHKKAQTKIKRVLICGGGRVSYYLATRLCNMGMQVKIIEKDSEKCENLCEILPKVTIINGDASDHDLLIEEGIGETDAFIALTGMDEENIIMALFAQSQQVPKVIVKINEERRARMVEDFGLDSVVSAKTATADAILSYVRARRNSQGSANVETMYQLVDGKVEALEFAIKAKTRYTDIPLKELSLKSNNLIACIVRNRKIIYPSGDDCIRVGDNVIVVTMEKQIQDIEEILL